MTQHIKALEEHYQQKFIDRTHKSFHLTKMGELLYHYAKTQMHNEKLFEKQLHDIRPSLIIGSTPVSYTHLSQIFRSHINSKESKHLYSWWFRT